ncbi:hypothetical protein K8R32_04255, partial [bacterium]|nr:hypothetical protein [bacterium]
MRTNNKTSLLFKSGMSLMEVIVSLFILMILMIGIFSLIILSLRLAADNKFYVEAMEMANQKMEYIRNLPYDDVGTLSGSPAGVIPQDETIIREGAFDIHTTVIFHDDPYDGLQGAGDNVFIDYKIATVEVSWQGKYSSKNVTVFSKIIPNTEETLAGYGLMKLLIVNSMGAPVPFADIHIENANNGLNVDLSADGSGELTYPVLPDIESYFVRTSTAGYGVDQTHARTVENANPTKPHLSIFDGLKTEESFTIDQLAALQINTVSNTLFNNWQVNNSLNSRDHINPRFSIDSTDNIYFSWQSQTATSSFVYVQKFNPAGIAQWANDKKIYTTQFQNNADIVTSGAGDSFVVWNDNSANLKSITKSLSPTRFANLNKNNLAPIFLTFIPTARNDFTFLSYLDSSLRSLSTRPIDLG